MHPCGRQTYAAGRWRAMAARMNNETALFRPIPPYSAPFVLAGHTASFPAIYPDKMAESDAQGPKRNVGNNP